jgi:hypothetical protein
LISEHISRVWSHVGTIQALKGMPMENQMTLAEVMERLEMDEAV